MPAVPFCCWHTCCCGGAHTLVEKQRSIGAACCGTKTLLKNGWEKGSRRNAAKFAANAKPRDQMEKAGRSTIAASGPQAKALRAGAGVDEAATAESVERAMGTGVNAVKAIPTIHAGMNEGWGNNSGASANTTDPGAG